MCPEWFGSYRTNNLPGPMEVTVGIRKAQPDRIAVGGKLKEEGNKFSSVGSRPAGTHPAGSSSDTGEQRVFCFLKRLDRHFPGNRWELPEELVE